MREILFRGQRVDNRDWVHGMPLYGNLDTTITEMQCYINNRHYIIEIKPESIGQFTGLKDKNGVEIYEGDVLGHNFGEVVFRYGAFGVITEWGDLHSLAEINEIFIEIIGNIHNK